MSVSLISKGFIGKNLLSLAEVQVMGSATLANNKGKQGIQAERGDTGAQGIAGINGQDGVDGTNGRGWCYWWKGFLYSNGDTGAPTD
jgi:hypothetical protein